MNNTVRFFCLLGVLFLSCNTVMAQDEFTDTREIIKNGYALYGEGKYAEAASVFGKVGRNDSSYGAALLETGISYFQDKQYEKAYEIALKGLALNSKYENSFYNTAAIALKNMERYSEAEKLFKEALSRYPNDHLLYYNLGLLYEGQKRLDSAVAYYKYAIVTNPFYASPHLRLGRIYALNEKPVQAMLALQLFLVLDPEGTHSLHVLGLLEGVSNNNFVKNDSFSMDFPQDNFSELELLLKSKVALNKNYKPKTKLNYVLPRQAQLLLEKLVYNEQDKDFFMQYYVPFYTKLAKNNFLEPLVYVLYASVQNEEVQKTVKKNLTKIKPFYTWAMQELRLERKYRPLVREDANARVVHFFYDTEALEATGSFADAAETVKTGAWTYYHSNGRISAKEVYTAEGKPDGNWTAYYETGELKGSELHARGKQNGPSLNYYKNGVKEAEATMIDDLAQGDLRFYYPSGQLKSVVPLVNNEKHGPEITYYRSGQKESEGNMMKGKKEGEFRVYYETGELKQVVIYKNDLPDGTEKQYYRSGKVQLEGNNRSGKTIGTWRFYNADGALIKEALFTEAGLATGTWKEYEGSSGLLEKEYSFDPKGLMTGAYKEYNKYGKVVSLYNYEADNIKSYAFFDSAGKVLSEGKEVKSVLKMVGRDPQGNILSQGEYVKGKMTGEWLYYDGNGSVEFRNSYKDGQLDGVCVEYYSNGSTYQKLTYSEGKLNGLSETFYRNNKPMSRGMYNNDVRQGDWYRYNSAGSLQQHEYYNADQRSGYWVTYQPNGKPDYESYYEYDMLVKDIFYDTTGKKYLEIPLKNGNGEYICRYPDGKLRMKGYYKSGEVDGDYIWYYANGKIQSTGNFFHGSKQGKFINFFDDGNILSESIYEYDKINGIYKHYYPSGKVSQIRNYRQGAADSVWTYYNDSGKKEYTATFKDNNREGDAYYYSAGEQVVCRKRFTEGHLISYSYLGKDGKFVPAIPVKKETASITAYYPNGQKSLEENLDRGNYEGKRVFYYPGGQSERIVWYKANMQEGEDVSYYASGKIRSRENYFYDALDGRAEYFRENGSKEMEGNFVQGERHGTWKFYDASGKLVKTTIYWYGQPYEVK